VVCLIPILYEMHCCTERTYAHVGPHEALGPDGIVTHRWVEELTVVDLPFNGYGEMDDEEEAG
jgi:hypothetical protein